MSPDLKEARTALIACVPRLRRYARALTGNTSAADDLVQDTMERGWRKLATWRFGTDMRAWLFGIMHNLHIDQFRKGNLLTETLDEDTPIPGAAATQEQGLHLRDLQTALNQLASEQREVLLLVALEDMPYEEVATTLGIPIGTVMSRLSRGREKLRTLMEGRPLASSKITP